jgi:hypothetical protein
MKVRLTSKSKDAAHVLRTAELSDGYRIQRGGYHLGRWVNHWFAVSVAGMEVRLGATASDALDHLHDPAYGWCYIENPTWDKTRGDK